MTSPAVPMFDLSRQYAAIRGEIQHALARVCATQQFILGPEVEALERELAEYCGTRYAVGVSSGTDALLMALTALDLRPGDEVLTSGYSFFATAGAIVRSGARPVFVDIDPATFNVDPARLARQITPRTRAIVPVHLYGQCAAMDEILALADRHGLSVVEDACQAIGAEDHGRRAGAMGVAGCFSFFPTKNLGGCGDGGAITTNDEALYQRLLRLRVHGSKVRYYHDEVGGNFRLDALQAAVLRVKLPALDQWTARRQANAALYDRLFVESGLTPARITRPVVVQNRHVFNQYVIRAVNRDALWQHLKGLAIGAEVYYPVPLHAQRCFAELGYRPGDLPHCQQAAETTLALPIFPELAPQEIGRVVEAVADYYRTAGLLRQAKAA